MGRKNLDSNHPVEASVPRLVHFAHSTYPQHGRDLEGAKSRSGEERHECARLYGGRLNFRRDSSERQALSSEIPVKSALHSDSSPRSLPFSGSPYSNDLERRNPVRTRWIQASVPSLRYAD